MTNEETIEFKARIISEKYYSDDTQWGAYNFVTDDDIPEFNNYKDSKSSTLVGQMQQLIVGSEYKIKAKLDFNKKYNSWQYKPIIVTSIAPKSKEQQKLLLQYFVRDDIANQLLEKYPNLVEDVSKGVITNIDTSEIKGLGDKTWNKIREKIIKNYAISDLITLLQPLGITYKMIKSLLKGEKNPTLLRERLERNPYMLLKIKGFGWSKADNLALKLKPQLRHSKERLYAFIGYVLLQRGTDTGDTHCSIGELKQDVVNNVPECIDMFEELLNDERFLKVYKYSNDFDKNRVGLKYMYDIEEKIFNILAEKSHYECEKFNFSNEEIETAIKEAEEEQGFNYTEEQRELIYKACGNNTLCVYSGKAGVGKSTVLRAITKVFKNRNMNISACALSAKASQRIVEATGIYASTIHRMLGSDVGAGGFMYNYDNPLEKDVVFLDEASMVSADIFYSLIQAIDTNTKLIICGDNRQLPPIGYGNIFSDLISRNDIINTFELTKVMRQAELSGILSDANKIREGVNPLDYPEPKITHGDLQDMHYYFKTDRLALRNKAIEIFMEDIKEYGLDEVSICVPRKQDCINSSEEINKIIHDKLLSDIDISIAGFKERAKVMQITNNYEKQVFNGEIGYITSILEIEEKGKKERFCTVTYKNPDGSNKSVDYTESEASSELMLGYALTTHKCQGSGYASLIGILDNTHYSLLDNCMAYTLITRAKKKCVLLSEPKAFNSCILTDHMKRKTWFPVFKYNPVWHYRDK